MVFKTIRVEFYEKWGRGFRTFTGWVYYMVSNEYYKFYEISPTAHHHKLLYQIERSEVKSIRETFI